MCIIEWLGVQIYEIYRLFLSEIIRYFNVIDHLAVDLSMT